MNIKILGACACGCNPVVDITKAALAELGVDANIEKSTDVQEMLKYGVMQSPVLVINEKVKAYGKNLSKDEIKKYIEEEK